MFVDIKPNRSSNVRDDWPFSINKHKQACKYCISLWFAYIYQLGNYILEIVLTNVISVNSFAAVQ